VFNLVNFVSLGVLYIVVVVSPGFHFLFFVLVNRLAEKSVSKMTYFVSSRTLTLTQSISCDKCF